MAAPGDLAAGRGNHTSHAAVNHRLFVAAEPKLRVARGQIRRAPEDRLMPIQRPGSTT